MAKPDYEHEMRVWEGQNALRQAMIDGLIQFAAGAIKGLLLLNGGALLALMSLYGVLVTKAGPLGFQPSALQAPVRLFVVGLACAVATFFASYLAQTLFLEAEGEGWRHRIALAARLAAVGFGLGSLALFCAGALHALAVMTQGAA